MNSTKKMIFLIAVVCAAPFASAWVAYYFFKPDGGASFGLLLKTQPVPPLPMQSLDTERAKGKFLLLHGADGACTKRCEDMLYSTRQARTMLGKETDRLARVLLGNNPQLSDDQRRAHPDLIVLNAPAPTPEIAALLASKTVLLDPLNNQVIAWDREQDVRGIKRLNGDLSRLMRATKWSTQP